ncbi:MAG TPA: hypothetical protein VG710_10035, partial [Opitutus sp.]|nr:hypothetical protein [Opitutus sp.]
MSPPVRLAATGCLTAFGDADATLAALLRGERALQLTPVLGRDGGEPVPLALAPGRAFDETAPPNWFAALRPLVEKIPPPSPGRDASPRRPPLPAVAETRGRLGETSLPATAQPAWGAARAPVFITSSNFGVGSLYAYRRTADRAHLAYGTPYLTVDALARELGWGANLTTLSHAC